LLFLGLCLGSFAGASVWRLRAYQLKADKKDGETVDAAEFKKLKQLTKHSIAKDRSVCLHCGYELRWYDLIPLVSWLSLHGKCRNCGKSIGVFEPLIEIGTAAFFVASYFLWPVPLDDYQAIVPFIAWLVSGVGLAILFAYDAKWFLLPDAITFSVVGVALASVVFQAVVSPDPVGVLVNAAGAVAILSGLYLLIYVISKGKWIGFGDVKLGLALGLLLADWQLAFVALFLANLVGCFIVIPGMITGKLQRTSYVPFGPLLIVGTILAKFFGAFLLSLLIVPIY
jgi:prepilin signal peptidase PulO-like enzyme (type II secretory pathway)